MKRMRPNPVALGSALGQECVMNRAHDHSGFRLASRKILTSSLLFVGIFRAHSLYKFSGVDNVRILTFSLHSAWTKTVIEAYLHPP